MFVFRRDLLLRLLDGLLPLVLRCVGALAADLSARRRPIKGAATGWPSAFSPKRMCSTEVGRYAQNFVQICPKNIPLATSIFIVNGQAIKHAAMVLFRTSELSTQGKRQCHK